MKIQNRQFWVTLALLSVTLCTSSCAKLQDSGVPSAKTEGSSLFMYPHQQTWTADHMGFALKAGAGKLTRPGTAHSAMPSSLRQCTACHAGTRQAQTLNISCGGSCHVGKSSGLPPMKPVAKVTACSECHEQGTSNLAHYPTAAGMCSSCHEVSAEHIPNFGDGAVTSRPESCNDCHDGVASQAHVHGALTSAPGCIQCHDPHDGKERFLLKGKPAALCTGCHEQLPGNPATFHGEDSAAGSCITCHQPHSADNAKLLKATCSSCHSDLTANRSRVHEAMEMEKGCINCHNPHDGKAKLLKDTSQALCTSCHNNEIASNPMPADATSIHGPINSQESCWSCHTPHAADNKHLLKPDVSCLDCHDRDIKGAARNIPSIKNKIDTSSSSHPGMGLECNECHKPHASEFVRLLNAKYSLGPYGEYIEGDAKTNTYALCFNCHETSMLKSEITGSGTGFRKDIKNGEQIQRRNLHAVHVANTGGTTGAARGRSCSVCHDVHGTTQNKMIKPSTGSANLKLIFQATEKGGNCTTACHGIQPYGYERID
ncbi:MAG TPA: hypothetical protein DCS07_06375 [Bdellovibrionales bacterium]|nr:MAG: hypothetical protein A2Z97_12310 [Bdellovibrionales bacterium GWB1_52_6]OFZ03725.1 MAG: hypothetical protein A2X97_14290 [Bdellovibrionales bacterium GWA1_52_35]OFZ41126.1 MAG: hypothetical protein A2070_08660 [Bdellovibrionales bacterium GWC1_52_8]HAR42242.1 hypothetical protein [Bdellovibrionales bacterium]HCM38764.1 hypothetical protein [Bdellovibrionales bacterium]